MASQNALVDTYENSQNPPSTNQPKPKKSQTNNTTNRSLVRLPQSRPKPALGGTNSTTLTRFHNIEAEQLNALFRNLMSDGTPRSLLRIVQGSRFTQRQKDAARARLAGTSAVVRQPVVDPTTNPLYNHIYAAHGGPSSWPYPRPVFSGAANSTRYCYLSGETVMASFTLAAGEVFLLVNYPYLTDGCLVGYVTNTGATLGIPVTSMSMSAEGCLQDRTLAPSGYASYRDHAPVTFIEDPDVVKSAPYRRLPTRDLRPTRGQLLSAMTQLQVAVPYNGSAGVWTLSPGDAPKALGRSTEPSFVVPASASQSAPGFEPNFRHPYALVDESPLAYAVRNGQRHLQMGASDTAVKHYAVCGMPDNGWVNFGVLDGTDAADGGFTSVSNGFMPRNNIGAHLHYGAMIVENYGSTNVVISYRARMNYAALVNVDDAGRSVSALASVMATQAPLLARHPAPAQTVLTPSQHGATPASVAKSIADSAKRLTGSAMHAASAAQDFMTNHPIGIQIAAGAAAYKTGLLNRIGSTVRNIFSSAESAAVSVATRSAPIVEEVVEGAEAAAPLLLMA